MTRCRSIIRGGVLRLCRYVEDLLRFVFCPIMHKCHDSSRNRCLTALQVVIVGAKIDQIKDRAVRSKDIDFARTRKLPYIEISSKANYHVKELLLGICKALLGAGTQLTDEVELAATSATVDEEAVDKARKEYADAK
jgi:hypothetical protein